AHRYFDVSIALLGVDLARIDLQLPVSLRGGERLGRRSLRPAGRRACRLGVAESADRLVVQLPAGQFGQQRLSLAERLTNPGQARHAAGGAGQVAVQTQYAVAPEIALTAGRAAEIAASHVNRPDGGQ